MHQLILVSSKLPNLKIAENVTWIFCWKLLRLFCRQLLSNLNLLWVYTSLFAHLEFLVEVVKSYKLFAHHIYLMFLVWLGTNAILKFGTIRGSLMRSFKMESTHWQQSLSPRSAQIGTDKNFYKSRASMQPPIHELTEPVWPKRRSPVS